MSNEDQKATIVLRTTLQNKGFLVAAARAAGLCLEEWCLQKLDKALRENPPLHLVHLIDPPKIGEDFFAIHEGKKTVRLPEHARIIELPLPRSENGDAEPHVRFNVLGYSGVFNWPLRHFIIYFARNTSLAGKLAAEREKRGSAHLAQLLVPEPIVTRESFSK